MKNKIGLNVLMAVFCLMLIFAGAAMGQARSKTSDASIARAINNQIRKVKADNPRTKIRIDLRVKNGIVRLMPRSGPKSVHQSVARYARNTRGVKKVEVTNPGCQSTGCPKHFYMCGGQCIPCLEVCSP